MTSLPETASLDNLIDQLYGSNALQSTREAWRTAVHTVAVKAGEKLPECNGRVEKAEALVLSGDVHLLDDHTAEVASQANGGTVYHVAPGHCDCRDFTKAPHGLCKHRLGAAMARRALDVLTDQQSTSASTPGIPAQYVVRIQGKPFIKFAGLLQMAHERGLVSLTAEWTYNDDALSLAHAVAVFEDGKRFEESGDASPANTGKTVALHFRRVALTRAKARVLRDALGVDLVAVEELGE